MADGRELMAEIERLLAGDVPLPDASGPGEARPVPVPPTPGVDAPRAARDRAARLRAGLRAALDEVRESDVDAEELDLLEAYEDATTAYLAALPRIDLARCPFTGATATLAVDTYGLDGPWWDYLAAVRPVEARPPTLVAFTGALSLESTDGNVEATPHLAKPGPGVPYVLPRLLGVEGVRAVIRALAVGGHAGWVVTYFAERYPEDAQRANDWGADHYPVDGGWDTVPEGADPRDFDLAPWMERGRLAWIAPGDATLTPRTTPEDCPYLGLAGEREMQRVEGTEVWTDSRLPGR